MTKTQAVKIAGSLGSPSKMPSKSYGLPAIQACPLAKHRMARDGRASVCASCYACKGRYVFPNVAKGHQKRLQGLSNPQWIDAMVVLIADENWFRWHDSGDITSLAHLERIAEVCKRTPHTRHWLPTHEHGIARSYLRKHGHFPNNLVVRLSADRIGEYFEDKDFVTSTVSCDETPLHCPAPGQGGKCDECRACWNRNVRVVDYRKH